MLTSVILYSNRDSSFTVRRGDVGRVGGIYIDDLVRGGVVRGASSYAEKVGFRHCRLEERKKSVKRLGIVFDSVQGVSMVVVAALRSC